ncbi:hypothetical protein [Silvanigrella sp.]|uniref:hypothetical protein n=1 Tax=Silvanigrella sp. TaxID=2024976 RepID=UPI0037C4FF3B
MLKNLLPITTRILNQEKNKNLFVLFLFCLFTIAISWLIQFKVYSDVSNGKTLYILISLLMISWFPFLISIFLIKIFRLSFDMLLLIPMLSRKLTWGILIPLLAAAVGIKLSLNMSQINLISPDSPIFLSGDTIFSALNLSLSGYIPIILFCVVVSLGTELSFRSFVVELMNKVKIKNSWLFAGLIQFIAFVPFLWFGYFGGGERNILYIIFWLVLFLSLSGFYVWLSILPAFDPKEAKLKKLKIDAKRSLILPIISSCLYLNIYYVVAARTLVENGNLWMSGPANVITVVIYFIITIFLLMTKRLKY